MAFSVNWMSCLWAPFEEEPHYLVFVLGTFTWGFVFQAWGAFGFIFLGSILGPMTFENSTISDLLVCLRLGTGGAVAGLQGHTQGS